MPAPNPEHLARMEERRARLRAALAEILPEGGSFVWELGCGHGHFLTAYAAAHPDRLCLGIDVQADRLARAERKRERAGLPNLHFVRAEARDFLESLPAGAGPAEIYILFPDPWPKRRHEKYRIMQPAFLEILAAKTPAGALLGFRTDSTAYFRQAEAAVRQAPLWRLSNRPWPFETPTVFQEKAPSYHSFVAERLGG